MYEPVKDGVEKSVEGVTYVEAPPPSELSDLVHGFVALMTDTEGNMVGLHSNA